MGAVECHALLRDVNELLTVRYTNCRIWVKAYKIDAPTMWLKICELREDLLDGGRTFRINEITFTFAL
jgi:hypothetical protein